MKQSALQDDVHRDLMLLKQIYGAKSISETIRRMMNLCGYKPDFFARIKLSVEGQRVE